MPFLNICKCCAQISKTRASGCGLADLVRLREMSTNVNYGGTDCDIKMSLTNLSQEQY